MSSAAACSGSVTADRTAASCLPQRTPTSQPPLGRQTFHQHHLLERTTPGWPLCRIRATGTVHARSPLVLPPYPVNLICRVSFPGDGKILAMYGQAGPVGTPDDAITAIQALIAGAWNTQLVYVAAKLGLADILYEGPRNADDIAAELGVNASAFRCVLRGLVNRGLVTEERAGTFSLTALGQYLRAGAPGALRDHAIRSGEIQYPAWGSLLYAVETGQSAFEHAHGADFFGYLAANPAVNNPFNEGMMARAESIVDEIVAAYDFSPFARIVDVGGGVGVLLSRILELHSASTGILCDSAAVTQKASAYLARRGLSGRAEVIAGNFFAAVPRGDLLVLQAILHNWDNERAALILRQCRKALEPNGRILIIEDVLPGKVDVGMPLIETALLMLVCHNGRERTLAEYEELLVGEGFRLESVGETGNSSKLITASAAPENYARTHSR
jgi:SAM-dependent methyltransferase